MGAKAMWRRTASVAMAWSLLAMAATAQDDVLKGVWDGTYICDQGLTALTLVIEPDGDQWSGIFSFGPDKSNKGVPRGSYKLSITERKGNIVFRAGDWLTQPEGYVTVDMHGRISEDLTTLSGVVDFEGCETFETRRRSVMPIIDGK